MANKPEPKADPLGFFREASLAHSPMEILAIWTASANATAENPKTDLLACWVSGRQERCDMLSTWHSLNKFYSSEDILKRWRPSPIVHEFAGPHLGMHSLIDGWLAARDLGMHSSPLDGWQAARDLAMHNSPLDGWKAARNTDRTRADRVRVDWVWGGAPKEVKLSPIDDWLAARDVATIRGQWVWGGAAKGNKR
jgi:hypothetical protein